MTDKRRRRTKSRSLKFTNIMKKKLVLLIMVMLLAFCTLVMRIIYINAADGENYAKIVLDQQFYKNVTIPYKRGDILDANGTKLATSERVYHIILDPAYLLYLQDEKDEKEIAKRDQNIEKTKQVLQKYFEIDPTVVDDALTNRSDKHYAVLKRNVPYKLVKQYEKDVENAKAEESGEDLVLKWITTEETYKRVYPYGSLASDTIGFTESGNAGKTGLEAYYNSVLNGVDGREYGYQNEDALAERTLEAAVNGNSIVTTIDVNLQAIVEKHLEAFYEQHRNGARQGGGFKNGAVLVMNPNTGEILAAASSPNYDLNQPRTESLKKYYSENQINSWSEAEVGEKIVGLWENYCVEEAFEPGSTIKPFTVATGLETGVLNGNETYYCGGYLHVGDHDVKCIAYDKGGHGTINLSQSLEVSCNVALMEMAEKIGVDNFCKYQHVFGFGETTGVDLPGEARTANLLYTSETMGVTDLATNSFGQNFNVSMIQLASGFSSLINGGNYYKPHVVKEIQDENGNVKTAIEPVLQKKTISKETSEKIKRYMYNVVESGSGSNAKVPGYAIGGKTGTAEKRKEDGTRDSENYILSFIGYAPQTNPEVVIYVVIDEPNVENQGYSSGLITSLSANIMKEAFPYLNITKNQ